MLPTVFTIPIPGWPIPIKGYGLMLMIGFLTAIWMTMRRAEKVRCNPDTVLNAGFLALLCGVLGARFFYVVHYWDSQFRGKGLWAAIDLTSGGLEFYGGFIAAVAAIAFYLRIKRYSVRLFLDIMAPSVMWGLAFGRMGCFLNGCCFGGICPKDFPWPLSVAFPYASPAHVHHFQQNRATLPRELMYVDPLGRALPIDREHIGMSYREIDEPRKRYREARQALDEVMKEMPENVKAAWRSFDEQRPRLIEQRPRRLNQEALDRYTGACKTLSGVYGAAFPDRRPWLARQTWFWFERPSEGKQLARLMQAEHDSWVAYQEQWLRLRDFFGDASNPRGRPLIDPSTGRPNQIEIEAFQKEAQQFHSQRVFSAQPFGVANAMILSGVLSLFFHRRRVHGSVFGLMFILYPITRVILEWIRADNPIDAGGLTISQAISLGVLPMALLYMLIIYKFLPPQSPRAAIWRPPPREQPPPSERSITGASSSAAGAAGGPVQARPISQQDKGRGKQKDKPRPKPRDSVVETVVVTPDTGEPSDHDWFAKEAICAKCGRLLQPPDGLVYQSRATKRAATEPRASGVPALTSQDPNTLLELLCEGCFDHRPPQDKTRAKRLAKRWWRTGEV
jgi:prolipoprotein diacylglyceryltransferase